MIAGSFKVIYRAVIKKPLVEFSLLLTLLTMLLIQSHQMEYSLGVLMVAICIILITTNIFLTHWQSWAFLFVVFLAWMEQIWSFSANHFFLYAYWLLACVFIVKSPFKQSLLYHHGRWLIGLTFLVAGCQKMSRPEFIDGSFLHFFILLGERFQSIPLSLGVLSESAINEVSALYQKFSGSLFIEAFSVFPQLEKLSLFSKVQSWGILGVEILIGILFLMKYRGRFKLLRDYLLIAFVIVTYFLSPPDSDFGMILIVLGIAQCPRFFPKLRATYFCVFIYLIFIYEFSDWINRLLGRAVN